MGFLAKAMGEVVGCVEALAQKQAKQEEQELVQRQLATNQRESEQNEEQEWKKREAAFFEAHPSEEDQAQLIAQYSREFPMLDPKGSVIRSLAISRWYEVKKKSFILGNN